MILFRIKKSPYLGASTASWTSMKKDSWFSIRVSALLEVDFMTIFFNKTRIKRIAWRKQ
jgi:hypothetical protein